VRRQRCPLLIRFFALKTDADAWGRQKEVELDRGEVVLVQRSLHIKTLGDLLSRYRAEVTPKKQGAGPQAARLAMMLRNPMADVPLNRLKPSLIAAYRDERLKTVSASTMRRELTILRHC
jgi:hypothetical protein